MIIRNKFNGYSNDGRRVYPGGGGGGPNYTYSQTSNIPEYAQPYVERMMGATEKQIFNFDDKGDVTGFKPYKSFKQAQEEIAELTIKDALAQDKEISVKAFQLPIINRELLSAELEVKIDLNDLFETTKEELKTKIKMVLTKPK